MCAGNGVADAGLGNGNPWTVGVINFKLKRPLFLLVSLIFGTPRPIIFWGRSGVLSAQITRWHEASRFMVTTLMRQDGKGIKATEYIQVFEEKWRPYFGVPDLVRTDPEGALRSHEIQSYFDQQGTQVDQAFHGW